ncbi:MAG: phosphoglucosamine mutase, partial [Solirubrobacteraceae bacterium]
CDRESRAPAGRGAVLLRRSGTDPLSRVMVEAPTEEEAAAASARIVAVVEAEAAR